MKGKIIMPQEVDCVVVPGVAFDCNGGRLGNGADHYDQLLQEVRSDAFLYSARLSFRFLY